MEGYKRLDPPATPQLAIPIQIPEHCQLMAYKTKNQVDRAIGDLAIIAFYYLLRVGEYTRPKTKVYQGKTRRTTRTQQFQVKNIGFFKDNKILPRASSLKDLHLADSCTMKITNQKNGRMGQTIHHYATKQNHCPIKAIANRIHHILSNGGSAENYICDTWDTTSNQWIQITAQHMMKGIRNAAKSLQMHKQGIDIDLIGVHSLRAGGAMALKLQGESDTTIMKMGRWTSLTFLQYIHNQIAHLNKDMSKQMSKQLHFQNIAAIEKST